MENWKQTHCAQICTAYVKLTESAFDAFARPCFCVPKFRLWLSAPLSFFGTFLVPYCKYLKVSESKQKMILVWVLDLFFLMFTPTFSSFYHNRVDASLVLILWIKVQSVSYSREKVQGMWKQYIFKIYFSELKTSVIVLSPSNKHFSLSLCFPFQSSWNFILGLRLIILFLLVSGERS